MELGHIVANASLDRRRWIWVKDARVGQFRIEDARVGQFRIDDACLGTVIRLTNTRVPVGWEPYSGVGPGRRENTRTTRRHRKDARRCALGRSRKSLHARHMERAYARSTFYFTFEADW